MPARGLSVFPMNLLGGKSFLRVLAVLALLTFAGDLAADAITDAMGGHCDAQSSQSSPTHEKSPCSHCSCATHIGAVVVGDFAVRIVKSTELADLGIFDDGARPTRRATSIDHPPQLA
jgi:anaerobic selenocysteine-containing dehydrogenase